MEVAELDVMLAKAELSFDAETELLAQWEVYDLDGQLLQRLEKIEYDLDIPDSVFALAIPAGAVVTDLSTADLRDLAARRKATMEALDQSGQAWNTGRIRAGECGTEFHAGLRFRVLSPDGIGVYYFPNRNTYFIVGRALVMQREGGFRRVVEDAEVAAPRPPDHSTEAVRRKHAGPPLPADLKAEREAKAQELRAAGAELCSKFGGRGMCGTPYHAGINFESMDDHGMELFYLPDRNVYYVIGKARVHNMAGPGSTQEIEDAEIAAPGPPLKPQ